MRLQTIKLVKLSICECGYAVLLDSIKVGTEYLVDLASIRDGFVYRCGKCGMVQPNVRVLDADMVLMWSLDANVCALMILSIFAELPY